MASLCASQQPASPRSGDAELANAFTSALKKAQWKQFKRIHNPVLDLYCDRDTLPDTKSGLKDSKFGLVDFERFQYESADKLSTQMDAVVTDWKKDRQRHYLYGGLTSQAARYDVATCNSTGGGQRGIVAIYMSGWEAWKMNFTTLLGR